jgi:hypothetical protein
MYIREFHPIDADEAIDVEHLSRAASSRESIRDSLIDDTVSRPSVQDEFQAFQMANSTFDLYQEAAHQLERNRASPCGGHCRILLRLNLTHEQEHACNGETRTQEFHRARLAPR